MKAKSLFYGGGAFLLIIFQCIQPVLIGYFNALKNQTFDARGLFLHNLISGFCLALLLVLEFRARAQVGKRFRMSVDILSFLAISTISYFQFFHLYLRVDVTQAALLIAFFLFLALMDILDDKKEDKGTVHSSIEDN